MAFTTNFTWVEKELLKKCKNNFLMIARPRKYNFAVPMASSGLVRLFFEPLCDEPEPINESGNVDFIKENYVVFDKDIDTEFLPDYYDFDSYDVEDKAEELNEFYQNKLVIFTPIYRINSEGQSFKNMQILEVIDDNDGAYFIPVPRIEIDPKKFENILSNEDYFAIPEFDNKLVQGTDMVICGDYAYRFKNKRMFESFLVASELRNEAWKYAGIDEIVKLKISNFDGYEDYFIEASRNIVFLEDNLYQVIIDSDNYISIDEEETVAIGEETFAANAVEDELIVEQEEIVEISEAEDNKVYNASEITFINGLKDLTTANNLVYEYKDLVNFHTSIKTNQLTILSGMSGTGKTQLAYNYARMLDLSEDNNTLLFMPISPAYSEPSDILGYLNPMTNEYVPAETGLVDFLVHANDPKNKNKMHMVIFDEMNLSQVEYWFSPFISVLEKDMGERYLKLYELPDSAKNGSDSENRKKYPPKIKIDDNVIFIGTVNIDETTKDFSDRLLDRTFVINLNKIKFKNVFEGLKNKGNKDSDIEKAKCGDASIFMNWNKKFSKNYLEAFIFHEDEIEFLDEFSELLSSSIHSDGISHRVLRNIGNYLLNIPETESGLVIEREEAFDIIINQTIMQKIRGTEAQLSGLVGISNSDTHEIEGSSLLKLLDNYSTVSKFENVRKAISKKAEDLRINGYTN